ncbi:hypothetical protein [Streptomyces sp. NPDC058671]|uniref:hypothetical protein n=1 Tax=Streptomyces sp. NPDC058671 TaxID=3346590 RepID=UPI0036544EF5
MDTLTTRDLEQIALQLTGRRADVRRRADQLPKNSGPKALGDVVLREAESRRNLALTLPQVTRPGLVASGSRQAERMDVRTSSCCGADHDLPGPQPEQDFARRYKAPLPRTGWRGALWLRCSGVGLLPVVVGGEVPELVIFLSDRFEENVQAVIEPWWS